MSNTNKQVEMLAGADRHRDTSLNFCGFSYFAKVLSLTDSRWTQRYMLHMSENFPIIKCNIMTVVSW